MTKKDLNRILTLYKKGFDRKMCIQAIIETSKSSYDAAQAISDFYTLAVIPEELASHSSGLEVDHGHR